MVIRMNQEKIGKFIALMRKEQNLTQKQLAELLGITDKSISKWETGRSMPDNALLLELCSVLKISVNELLSGERLSLENYDGRAEENMLHLMKEHEKQKETNKWNMIGIVLGVVIFLVVLFFVIALSVGISNLTWLIDLQSLFAVVGISLGMLIITGMLKDFVYGFRICYGTKNIVSCECVMKSYVAMKLVMVTAILAGLFTAIISIVALLGNLADFSTVGNKLIIVLMSIMYSIGINLLLLPTLIRLYVLMNVKE